MRYIALAPFMIAILMVPSFGLPFSHAMVSTPNYVSDSDVLMKKSVISMYIPSNPSLPFGCVWGTVQNAAPGYPVDIEIYKNDKPVYFAQANVTSDGSYEKYFRVANTVNGHETNIFEGQYTVEIFKYIVNATTTGAIQT